MYMGMYNRQYDYDLTYDIRESLTIVLEVEST